MMNRLRAFMAGRNGIDGLGYGLLVLAILLNAVRNFLRQNSPLAGILSLLAAAALLCCVLRMLSRNIAARQRENRRFMSIFRGAKGKASDIRYRVSNAGQYKFFTCPGCHNKLRVPRGKGKIQITCPKCGQRFGGRS